MKSCTSFGARLGMHVRDFLACYFGRVWGKAFMTLRNVSSWFQMSRSCFGISSRYLRVLWFILIFIYYSGWKYWLQKYFTENIEAIRASNFKIRAKSRYKSEQFSVRLTSQTSLLISGMSSHKFLQSAFQFGFLLSKPCLFPLKSSLEFVLHPGKPKFISLPVTLPADRSKFQFCTTARMKLIIIFYANCTAVFVFFFS